MAHDPGTPTAHAVSPDSGEHWTAEGAWPVAPGIHRIPLPLPMDGLRAINVYVIETPDDGSPGGGGLTLVDGGWHIDVARDLLDRSLRSMGAGFGDIRRFLVTHAHRDHYTMARVLAGELGVDVALGREEQPALELITSGTFDESPFRAILRTAGALEVAEHWTSMGDGELAGWQLPTTWIDGDQEIAVGDRTLDAVHTPGHTPGHYVFADRAAGLLFAGDHVLPTITPSIGFTVPAAALPLGDFMASLTKVRGLPDLTVLPAHGPVAPSSHARVGELLAHHEERLGDSLAAVPSSADDGAVAGATALDVARTLGWTRHLRSYESLDWFNRGMAVMETKAHLDLLVARGDATATDDPDGVRYLRTV
ncbi:MBL fold metallo-hydrolase [Nocardioides dongxiaopingii]|uniref:MBL fold metallo-hydrolase n=1 Tax=Nocardioides TaxID=1839 RepID=UPI0010C76F51|nr:MULTISPECIES: MBL fold metallo-hydrolase [Nocardioides]QDH10679.1 MBL fold metallo-hydrolase [Nocardioides sp. S-1144]